MMELTTRQVDVIRHRVMPETLLLAGGAVRSGKSYAVWVAFLLSLLDETEPRDHAMVGQSIESIMRNVGFDFIEGCQSCGAVARLDRQVGTRIIVHGKAPQNVWLIGANDAKARRRIQGSTLKTGIVEELPLIPEDFWWFMWSRFSLDGAKVWASYNPEGPGHWAKRRVVDAAETLNGRVVRFRLEDNPTLSRAVIERLEGSFTGHFRKRLIEGEWAAAAGACYPDWTVTDEEPQGQWHLLMDWAVSGTMAALALRSKGREGVVRHELYHEGRTDGLLNEDQVAARVKTWFREVSGTEAARAWPDPATPNSFKRLLRKAGFKVMGVDNDVVPGIVTTAARLARGEVRIHRDCVRLQDELAGYVWDEKAALAGDDKPVKDADHGADALRYWAHSTGKAYRYANPTRVSDALH